MGNIFLCKRVDDKPNTETYKFSSGTYYGIKDRKERRFYEALHTLQIAFHAKLKKDDHFKICKKRQRKRIKKMLAEKEMVDIEVAYLENLKILRDRFQIPIENLAKKKRYPLHDINNIFSYLEPIIKLHEDTILVELQSSYEEGRGVASAFLKYAKFFGIYAQYLKNYNLACDTLHKYRTKHKSFSRLLDMQRMDEKSGRRKYQEIVSYLIMPCQRISRYQLLLKEILSNSFRQDDPKRYEELEKAHEKVRDVAMQNELFQKNSEDISRLMVLQQTVKGLPASFSIFAPTRRLIRESQAMLGCKPGSPDAAATDQILKAGAEVKKVPGIVYVFSDFILWTNDKNVYLGSASLGGGRVAENLSDSETPIEDLPVCVVLQEVMLGVSLTKSPRTLKKRSKTKSVKDALLSLSFRKKKKAIEWVETTRDAVLAFDEANKSLRARLSSFR
mmetsp:Transcript_27362/g.48376  ORF Transcript_27362/g.48376 Transcript_27362/m.48376 type:complete len:446 (-) Transcript_27362:187-1524(-)|eukprot:CAMPEP_0197515940 /NCGR_PEP_ID=MMETSP1318-20131121/890_1 /TAXON_ID=552666 /ORGANISM="Partenskyella glossopodia, Strain RCC365" /LENGTH=445 /DNA_ID=CAMNT_0043064423 /DNA_START=364 /DNA_END=1701 /DNA_ORIENTATION=-